MTKHILFCFIIAFQISLVLCQNDLYKKYFSRHDRDSPVAGTELELRLEDPCYPNPCQNGGTCIIADLFGLVYCDCAPGYYGMKCEKSIFPIFETTPELPTEGPCYPNPCKNGGTCNSFTDGITCDCTADYVGTWCEIDPCSPNPCKNDGRCSTFGGNVRCDCRADYDGLFCEKDTCSPNPCMNGGTCNSFEGDVTCNCHADFKGARCEKDTNTYVIAAVVSLVIGAILLIAAIVWLVVRCLHPKKSSPLSRLVILVRRRQEPFEQDNQEENLPPLPPPYDTVPVQQHQQPPSH